MSTQKMSLGVMIEGFASRVLPEQIVPALVQFRWCGLNEVVRTNLALKNMCEEEGINFLLSFLEIWHGAFYNATAREELLQELHQVFGDSQDTTLGCGLMYTLTADGKQFRCWYGMPGGSISPNHVESHGEGCLFEVKGGLVSVGRYVEALLSTKAKEKRIMLPNGVQIWGLYWNWHR